MTKKLKNFHNFDKDIKFLMMSQLNDEKYMSIALDLARRGFGAVSPNPMVGAVIVGVDGDIIGSGWHERCGYAHAEVNAIASCGETQALRRSTMYVTLEPCSHYGKTPPCADLIIRVGIPRVVVACVDPFEAVAGRGIEKLRDAGVEVTVGVLQKEAQYLNRRFFTYVQKQRPYIILKWAQSSDGALDIIRTPETPPAWITGDECRAIVHKWRSQENAVMVGSHTAILDNPSLTVRDVKGRNPMRIVIDKNLTLPLSLNLFSDAAAQTIVFTNKIAQDTQYVKFVKLDFSTPVIPQILTSLYSLKIQSLIVEGGAILLNSFIQANIWDEARIFTTSNPMESYYPDIASEPIPAPVIEGKQVSSQMIIDTKLSILQNEL